MKSTVGVWVICIVGAVMLPGCGRVVDWVRDTFDQGSPLEQELTIVRNDMRVARVYEQFTTLGKFDALWLSDAVRTAYVDVHARKHGLDDERKTALLRRQLAENNHYITFYVLGLVESNLTDEYSDWSLFLQVDGNHFTPVEIKSIDLSPEYQLFFGKRLNTFKVAYSVKFNAKDISDTLLIGSDTDEITLYFRSTRKETAMRWPVLKE